MQWYSSSNLAQCNISCLSLILQLLGLLLSSEVTGREELPDLAAINRRKAREEEKEEGEEDDDEEDMHEKNSTSGSESSRIREGNYEVRTVSFPKALLKMMVTSAEAEDLLGELRTTLEVGKGPQKSVHSPVVRRIDFVCVLQSV